VTLGAGALSVRHDALFPGTLALFPVPGGPGPLAPCDAISPWFSAMRDSPHTPRSGGKSRGTSPAPYGFPDTSWRSFVTTASPDVPAIPAMRQIISDLVTRPGSFQVRDGTRSASPSAPGDPVNRKISAREPKPLRRPAH